MQNGTLRVLKDGTRKYWLGRKLHRIDGPACEWANGKKFWYIDGVYCTEQSFKKKIQEMNASKNSSYNGKVVKIDSKKYKLQEIG